MTINLVSTLLGVGKGKLSGPSGCGKRPLPSGEKKGRIHSSTLDSIM